MIGSQRRSSSEPDLKPSRRQAWPYLEPSAYDAGLAAGEAVNVERERRARLAADIGRSHGFGFVVMAFEVRAKARIDRRAVGQHRSRQSDDLARAAGRGDRASGVAAPLARKSPCRPQWAVICGARTVAATNSR